MKEGDMRAFIVAALIGVVFSVICSASAQQTPKDPFAYCESVKNIEVNSDEKKTPR